MTFEPDILVSSDEDDARVLFAVEAKRARDGLTGTHLADAERQLRSYMRNLRCTLGAIVTPVKFHLYQDTFRSNSSDSIERVGSFDLDDERLSEAATQGEAAFESTLQEWVESLRDERARELLPAALRDAVETHIVPVLWLGHARAAHHRTSEFRRSAQR